MTLIRRTIEALEEVANAAPLYSRHRESLRAVLAELRGLKEDADLLAALLEQGEPDLKRAMSLGWTAARNPFHERMDFDVWFNAVGAKRIAEGYFARQPTEEAHDG